jgi:hypothetical protein
MIFTAVSLGLLSLAFAPMAHAASTPLVLSQGDAFSLLGHSCGGIQEQVYATGFGGDGYPTGDAYVSTRCGGSGRGGGYKTTTYSAWASVSWDWFAETRTFVRLQGPPEVSTTFSAEDAHGDRVYNVGTSAFLELGEPPLSPPAPATGVAAEASTYENAEEHMIHRFLVTWTPAAPTAGRITSSTVTATPVGSSAPVLTTNVSGPATSAVVEPLQSQTTYQITVTNTDDEGTSQPSLPIEQSSAGSEPPPALETCAQNHGTIKLVPGLEETPHVQSITLKGELSGCDGSRDVTGATYVAHLVTTEAVTCSALLGETATTPVSLLVKWLPLEAGSSKGTITIPLGELGGPLTGTLEGGPFASPASAFASSVSESFTGASTCGVVPVGRTTAKLVKKGAFATSLVEIG